MLNVYINVNSRQAVLLNDWFFETVTLSDFQLTDELRLRIEQAEQVKFESCTRFTSKFNDTSLDLTKLSTGCKTLINILTFPEKIFSVSECGVNILKEIYSLRGEHSIYCKSFVSGGLDIDNDFRVITDSFEKEFHNSVDISGCMLDLEEADES